MYVFYDNSKVNNIKQKVIVREKLILFEPKNAVFLFYNTNQLASTTRVFHLMPSSLTPP
jgi:hypothetical protein